MPPTKVTAVGIGSFIFGVELLRDLFQTDELRGCHLTLVDIDADRLRLMAGLAERLNDASGWGATITATPDRAEGLPGSTFVVTAIEVNRDALWQLDHEICMRHGLPSVLSENGGPGGLSHALRTVPLMMDLARDIERYCPDALLINYTNPEGRVCLAIRRNTNVRAVGLCHGVAGTVPWLANIFERSPDDIDLQAAGVNHFTWTVKLTDASGSDLYPELRERLASLPPDEWPFCRMLYDRFGLFPTTSDSHVGEYVGWAAEICGTKGYDFAGIAAQRVGARENIEGWGNGTKSVDALLAQPSREARVKLSSARIMADVVSGQTRRYPSFILPNEGYIANISADAVVEVPGLVENGRVCALTAGELPGPIASMVQNEVEIQKLAVDAAVTGSRDLALAALLLDPVVNSSTKAEAVLDDILTSHAPYLPNFAS